MKFSWFGNIALTLDNKLGKENEQTNISNYEDFGIVHHFRDEIAAIGVGSSTILVDNPSLRTREGYLVTKPSSHPIPIIFDRRGRISMSSKVITSLPDRPVIWVTNSDKNDLPSNVFKITFSGYNQLISEIEQTLRKLGRTGGIMIEGGRTLMMEFIVNKVLSRIRIYTSNFELNQSSIQLYFTDERKFRLLMIRQLSEGFERVYSIE